MLVKALMIFLNVKESYVKQNESYRMSLLKMTKKNSCSQKKVSGLFANFRTNFTTDLFDIYHTIFWFYSAANKTSSKYIAI